MKSSYSGFPEGLPIMLEPSGPNFAPHPTLKRVTTFVDWYVCRRRDIEGEMIQRLQRDFGVVVS